MKKRTISQREARELKKRVIELEAAENNRRLAWAREYPGGVHLCSVVVSESTLANVRTARKLKHAVVALVDDRGMLALYALPMGERSKT